MTSYDDDESLTLESIAAILTEDGGLALQAYDIKYSVNDTSPAQLVLSQSREFLAVAKECVEAISNDGTYDWTPADTLHHSIASIVATVDTTKRYEWSTLHALAELNKLLQDMLIAAITQASNGWPRYHGELNIAAVFPTISQQDFRMQLVNAVQSYGTEWRRHPSDLTILQSALHDMAEALRAIGLAQEPVLGSYHYIIRLLFSMDDSFSRKGAQSVKQFYDLAREYRDIAGLSVTSLASLTESDLSRLQAFYAKVSESSAREAGSDESGSSTCWPTFARARSIMRSGLDDDEDEDDDDDDWDPRDALPRFKKAVTTLKCLSKVKDIATLSHLFRETALLVQSLVESLTNWFRSTHYMISSVESTRALINRMSVWQLRDYVDDRVANAAPSDELFWRVTYSLIVNVAPKCRPFIPPTDPDRLMATLHAYTSLIAARRRTEVSTPTIAFLQTSVSLDWQKTFVELSDFLHEQDADDELCYDDDDDIPW